MAIKASSQVSLLDITDAYSVTLTSETFTFVGNTTGAPSGLSCTTQAVAYCGSTKCSKVTIGTVSCPTGISATISNNNTESPTITFKTTATITAACEAIIPVTVDGITINKKFSFSVAKKGNIPEEWCAKEDKTYINGAKIYTGSITADKLDTNAIKSKNYVSNSTGTFLNLKDGSIDSKNFKVDSEGNIVAKNMSISGAIRCDDGLWMKNLNGESAEYGTYFKAFYHSPYETGPKILSNVGIGISGESRFDLLYAKTLDAGTLQLNGKNISTLFASASHSHSYLPLSGGTLTGALTMSNNKYIMGKNKSGKSLVLIGVNSSNNVHIGSTDLSHNTYIHGGDGSTVYTINFNAARFGPGADNKVTLGYSAHRWKQLIAGTTAISTSDKNLKENIEPLSDKYVDMLLRLTPVSFRFKDGDSGRTHVGFISQDVEQIMSELGLSALDFAGFCKDQKMDEILDDNGDLKEEIPYVDENGEPVYIYSLRYEEFIAINTCMIQKLYKRVEELEAKLSNS